MPKKRNIYACIDTNIYLSYFGLETIHELSERINALKKLKEIIDEEELILLLPQQIRDEYIRYKGRKIKTTIDQINQIKKVQLPIEKIGEYKYLLLENKEKLKNNIKKINNKLSKLINKYKKEKQKEIVSAEKLIEEIMEKAEPISIKKDKKIIERAYERYLKGNPPLTKITKIKDNKYEDKCGDAIIWELLLEKFMNEKKKITVITDDGGWYDNDDKEKLNSLLLEEWQGQERPKITIRSSLSYFINEFTKKDIVEKEVVEKEKNIESYTFSSPSYDDQFGIFSTITGKSDISSITPFIGGDILSQGINPDLYNQNLSSVIFHSEKYQCKNCKKDITKEVNQFAQSVYLNKMSGIGPYNKTSLYCPHCNEKII